jgi:hypothetical protein
MINISMEAYGRPFSIKLKSGIYVFPTIGGTGKSYAADLLKAMQLENVLVVEYSKNKRIMENMLAEACSGKYDLVYMDRTDRYMNEDLFDDLLTISGNTTIVLDMKKRPDYTYGKMRISSIYFGKEGVDVF